MLYTGSVNKSSGDSVLHNQYKDLVIGKSTNEKNTFIVKRGSQFLRRHYRIPHIEIKEEEDSLPSSSAEDERDVDSIDKVTNLEETGILKKAFNKANSK